MEDVQNFDSVVGSRVMGCGLAGGGGRGRGGVWVSRVSECAMGGGRCRRNYQELR